MGLPTCYGEPLKPLTMAWLSVNRALYDNKSYIGGPNEPYEHRGLRQEPPRERREREVWAGRQAGGTGKKEAEQERQREEGQRKEQGEGKNPCCADKHKL